MTNQVENKIQSAVRSIEPSREFSDNLWKQIKNSPIPVRKTKSVFRWAWIPAAAVLTFTLVLAFATPQSVMAAFRNLIAYLPGIGFVQKDASTLYLQEPLTVEQEGITLTLEQVVADANQTVVSYHIDGMDENQAKACFYDQNSLLLPDGKTWLPAGGGVSNNEARVEFFPLPQGISQAALLVSMNSTDPACTAPEEWKVDFTLSTTVPEGEFAPVYVSEEAPSSPAASSEEQTDNPVEPSESTVQFVVDQTAVLEDGYLLLGHIEWAEDSWENVRIDMETAYATDAAGNTISLVPTDEGSNDNEFAFKVATKEFTSPLTLHIENLMVWAKVEDAPSFSFDAGSDPQVGQTWDVDENLEIAGQAITIHKVSAVQETTGTEQAEPVDGYAVEISSASELNGFLACAGDQGNMNGWGQTRDTSDARQILEMMYPDGLPTGQVTCKFQQVQFNLTGSWQIEWQSPADAQ